jgi:hypothetical protein
MFDSDLLIVNIWKLSSNFQLKIYVTCCLVEKAPPCSSHSAGKNIFSIFEGRNVIVLFKIANSWITILLLLIQSNLIRQHFSNFTSVNSEKSMKSAPLPVCVFERVIASQGSSKSCIPISIYVRSILNYESHFVYA